MEVKLFIVYPYYDNDIELCSCINGQCIDSTCICDMGWNGTQCSEGKNGCMFYTRIMCFTLIAICIPMCQNGQCISPGICECDVGWTGDRCRVGK